MCEMLHSPWSCLSVWNSSFQTGKSSNKESSVSAVAHLPKLLHWTFSTDSIPWLIQVWNGKSGDKQKKHSANCSFLSYKCQQCCVESYSMLLFGFQFLCRCRQQVERLEAGVCRKSDFLIHFTIPAESESRLHFCITHNGTSQNMSCNSIEICIQAAENSFTDLTIIVR